ncbi:MAG: HlyD family efflux transporter periplasmic adaptor subunit [Fuerstiella sp.]
MISRSDFVRTAEAGNINDAMLAPSAYADSLLPSLRLAKSSRRARLIGKILLTLLVCGFILVAIAPWQQTVSGAGMVTAFSPNERPQKIEVLTKGRLVRLGENIYPNAKVKKGDLIAVVEDLDPEYRDRLAESLETTREVEVAAMKVLQASKVSLEASEIAIASYRDMIESSKRAKDAVLDAADSGIAAAENKVSAQQQALTQAEAAFRRADLDYTRHKLLVEQESMAIAKLQEAEQKYFETKAKVESSKAYIQEAENNLKEKVLLRSAKEQEAQMKIDEGLTKLQKAQADVGKAGALLSKAASEVSKAEKYRIDAETKLARQDQGQEITAPFDGTLMNITANQTSQMLKEGDLICEIVPLTRDRAVEVWLDGNDAPLVTPGRHVRLQFEGWPAIQFAGWPSAAVGTFGGVVASVDETDIKGIGKFRVIVKPDLGDGVGWPDDRYLRQGVRANAWVLLDKVDLWYEIWRNMNGFPPVVEYDPDMKKPAKPPKLPK